MASDPRLTVVQGKFAAYLAWSQPFLHQLISGLERHVRSVVLCNRAENLDRFPTPRLARIQTRYLADPPLALLAAAYLERAWQPDLLHAHFGWSGIRMLLLRQFLRVPLVTTFGGKDLAVQMREPYYDRLYQVLLDASEQIICVSRDLERLLLDRGVEAERIAVIHRGTDLTRFAFVDRSDRDPRQPVRLLMVGRLIEKKGHEHAFRALAALAAEGVDLRLTVVGEGEAEPLLRKLRGELGLVDRVELVGTTDHAGVCARMRAADVFLQCSVTGADGDREGLPNAVVEAAATGLPVVGTLHGGIAEAVADGVTGRLVAEREPEALASALRELATGRGRRLEMGRAASHRIRAEFDLEVQIERHRAIYARLVEEHPATSPRMQRSFIPEDFLEVIDHTLRPRVDRTDFSVGELVQWLLDGRRVTRVALSRPEPGLLERFYLAGARLPPRLKRPAKLVAGRLLLTLIEWRQRLKYGAQLRALADLDRRVLDFFRTGRDLEGIDPGWSVEDLALFLPGLEAQGAEPPGVAAGAPEETPMATVESA